MWWRWSGACAAKTRSRRQRWNRELSGEETFGAWSLAPYASGHMFLQEMNANPLTYVAVLKCLSLVEASLILCGCTLYPWAEEGAVESRFPHPTPNIQSSSEIWAIFLNTSLVGELLAWTPPLLGSACCPEGVTTRHRKAALYKESRGDISAISQHALRTHQGHTLLPSKSCSELLRRITEISVLKASFSLKNPPT